MKVSDELKRKYKLYLNEFSCSVLDSFAYMKEFTELISPHHDMSVIVSMSDTAVVLSLLELNEQFSPFKSLLMMKKKVLLN